MTGVIALATEHIAKDFHCFNITQTDKLYCTEPDVIVIIYIEAMVNGRLIYTTCHTLFYTKCHLCIKTIHYHRRQAWTRLKIMK